MAKAPTQAEQIVDYIRKHGSITRLEAANKLFIFELSARIVGLEKRGWTFKKERITKTNTIGQTKSFTKYSIEEEGAFI